MCTCYIMRPCGQHAKWSSRTLELPPFLEGRRMQVTRSANVPTLFARSLHKMTISSFGKTEQPLVGVLEHVPTPVDSSPDSKSYDSTPNDAILPVSVEDESQYGFDFLPPTTSLALNAAAQMPLQSPTMAQPVMSLQPPITSQPQQHSDMGSKNNKPATHRRKGFQKKESAESTGNQQSEQGQQHIGETNNTRMAPQEASHQQATGPDSSDFRQRLSTSRWMASWTDHETDAAQMNTGITADDSLSQTTLTEESKQSHLQVETRSKLNLPAPKFTSQHQNRRLPKAITQPNADNAMKLIGGEAPSVSAAASNELQTSQQEHGDNQPKSSNANVRASSTTLPPGNDLDNADISPTSAWGGYVRIRKQQREIRPHEPQQDTPWWQLPVEQALQSCPKEATRAVQQLSPVLDGGKAYSSAGSNATTLFIKGLPSQAPESLTRAALVAAFERAGPIQQVRLPSVQTSDGKRELRGIAYVVFTDAHVKAGAAELVGQHQVLGRWLKCDLQPTADSIVKGRDRQGRATSQQRPRSVTGDSSIPHRNDAAGMQLQPGGRQRTAKSEPLPDSSHVDNRDIGVARNTGDSAVKQSQGASAGRASNARRGRFLE